MILLDNSYVLKMLLASVYEHNAHPLYQNGKDINGLISITPTAQHHYKIPFNFDSGRCHISLDKNYISDSCFTTSATIVKYNLNIQTGRTVRLHADQKEH